MVAMQRMASFLPVIFAFISLFLHVNSQVLPAYDEPPLIYVPTLSHLSEADKNSLIFSGDFKKYQSDNNWKEEESTNFVLNDDELVGIIKNLIAAKESFQAVNQFCLINGEKSTATFLETIFSTPLFAEMADTLKTSMKTDEAQLSKLFRSQWLANDRVLRHHFCGPMAENWVSLFSDRKTRLENAASIVVEDQVIKSDVNNQSDVNNGHRLLPFGISPEFEIAVATFCFISMSSIDREPTKRPYRIYKCEFDLFPSNRAVVLSIMSSVDRERIIDIWYENSESSDEPQAESPNATIKKEGKKKKKRKPDQQLIDLVSKMWESDVDNRLPESAVQFNYGNPVKTTRRGTTDDQPQENLVASLDESIFDRPIYRALLNIYNASVFHPPVCTAEDPFAGERLAIVQTFLLEATNTTTFKLAYDYLVSKGKAESNFEAFRAKLFDDWFGNYSRCGGALGSSGFEHVFCGEFRDSIVDGHHSWVNYWLSQQRGEIEYYGYYTYRQKNIVTIRYKKNGFLKAMGGFLFRSSPAFDFSLFTVCYLTHRGNEACKFKIEDDDFWVTSFSEQCSSGYCIATSYPGTHLPPFASPDVSTTTSIPTTTSSAWTETTQLTTTGNESTTASAEPVATTTTGNGGARSDFFVPGVALLLSVFLRFTISQIL